VGARARSKRACVTLLSFTVDVTCGLLLVSPCSQPGAMLDSEHSALIFPVMIENRTAMRTWRTSWLLLEMSCNSSKLQRQTCGSSWRLHRMQAAGMSRRLWM
jgi:hypothetical protein